MWLLIKAITKFLTTVSNRQQIGSVTPNDCGRSLLQLIDVELDLSVKRNCAIRGLDPHGAFSLPRVFLHELLGKDMFAHHVLAATCIRDQPAGKLS